MQQSQKNSQNTQIPTSSPPQTFVQGRLSERGDRRLLLTCVTPLRRGGWPTLCCGKSFFFWTQSREARVRITYASRFAADMGLDTLERAVGTGSEAQREHLEPFVMFRPGVGSQPSCTMAPQTTQNQGLELCMFVCLDSSLPCGGPMRNHIVLP